MMYQVCEQEGLGGLKKRGGCAYVDALLLFLSGPFGRFHRFLLAYYYQINSIDIHYRKIAQINLRLPIITLDYVLILSHIDLFALDQPEQCLPSYFGFYIYPTRIYPLH